MRRLFTQSKIYMGFVLTFILIGANLLLHAQNILNGYYTNANGKTGYELKTVLHNIIKGHSTQSYSSLWAHFETTDKKANGKVWDMYSNCDFTYGSDQQDNGTGGGTECDKFNREHSFPKSWFADASPMESDLYHLYPTDKKVNNERGSFPFGEVGSVSYTSANGSKKGSSSYAGYSGTVFEPLDEYKGDFARTYFYMATRYQDVIANWPGSAMLDGSSDKVFTTWALNMLTEWHEQDPVSAKEIARVDAVYGIQNNRNPYIDHPEYVTAVWGTGNGGGGNTNPMVSTTSPANGFNFGNVVSGNSSVSQTYKVSGSNLTEDISLATSAPFQISSNNTTWSTNLVIPQASANNYDVYVRFSPTEATGATSNGSIQHTSSGVTTLVINLTGKEGELEAGSEIIENFSTCTAPAIGTWAAHSIKGDQFWDCSPTFGVGGSGAARMNSFVAGANNENEDWLVSPKFTLFAGASFSLKADLNFTGNAPKLKISSNYSGTGSPAAATWTDLGETWPAPTAANGDFETITADLSDHVGDRYIALVYYSTASSGSRLTVDDFVLVTGSEGGGGETPTMSTTAPSGGYNFGFVVSGNHSASQNYKVSGTNLTADIALSTTAPFEISSNNTTWSTDLVVPQGSATNYDIYVRYSPTVANGAVANGTIQHTSAGATAVLVNISGTEGEQGVTPIGTVRAAVDANGVPTWAGPVSLQGIVHGVNILTGNQFQFSLIDDTGAITIRNAISANAFGTLTEGDEVEVVGTVGHFNGLMQITVTQAVEILSSGNPIVPADVVALLNEDTESDLVTLENVTITNPAQWLGTAANTASFNVDISVNGNLYVMRIDKATDLAKKTLAEVLGSNTTNNLEITGLGGQFDNSAPHSAGYQILPYRLAHVRVGIPRATLSFESVGASLIEPTSNFLVKIVLDQPTTASESLTINISNGANVTYGVGQDYGILPAAVDNQFNLNISAGATSVFFVVNVHDDELLEDKESVVFTIGNISNGLKINNLENRFELSIIDNNPSFLDIKEVRSANNQGRSIYEEELVKVEGVVHGINTLASDNLMEFRLIDTTEGKRAALTVRKLTTGDLGYTIAEGDKVSVTGLVNTQDGLLTLDPTEIIVLSTAQALAEPIHVTNLVEAHESDLVHLSILVLQSGWGEDLGGYYNVTVTDGLQQFIMRIDDDTDIFETSAPQALSVTGFVVQDDPLAPYDGDYHIMPRALNDLSFLTQASDSEGLDTQVSLFPNPSAGILKFKGQANTAYEILISNIQGKQVYSDVLLAGEVLDLTNFKEGMYIVKFSSTLGIQMQKIIIKK